MCTCHQHFGPPVSFPKAVIRPGCLLASLSHGKCAACLSDKATDDSQDREAHEISAGTDFFSWISRSFSYGVLLKGHTFMHTAQPAVSKK
jgi:hypothetical protein